ncbi:MAG: hypothetical protein LBR33_07510 [Propionibacteriaceae bacterium]|jgi:hypothetical protein|nr:hypothetical protein [Propionibacteriaceae bacterium]
MRTFARLAATLGALALAAVTALAGQTAARFQDAEWADAPGYAIGTLDLRLSADGAAWTDTSADGRTPDTPFETVTAGPLNLSAATLLPGVAESRAETQFYVQNAGTAPLRLALALADATAQPSAVDAAFRAQLAAGLTLAVPDGAAWRTVAATADDLGVPGQWDPGVTLAPAALLRVTVTVRLLDVVDGTGSLDQAATNALQGGRADVIAVVTAQP